MLKKTNRISRNKDFDRAFKAGRSFYSQILGIKAAKNERETNRLGILISVKVSKKAVTRNLFKRRIREIVKQELPKIKVGHDLVIIVLPKIIEKDFLEIKSTIIKGLRVLNLYK